MNNFKVAFKKVNKTPIAKINSLKTFASKMSFKMWYIFNIAKKEKTLLQ